MKRSITLLSLTTTMCLGLATGCGAAPCQRFQNAVRTCGGTVPTSLMTSCKEAEEQKSSAIDAMAECIEKSTCSKSAVSACLE